LALLRERISGLGNRLQGGLYRIDSSKQQVRDLLRRAMVAMHTRRQDATTKLQLAAGRLDTLSPLATLNRGYAIVTCAGEKSAIRDTAELKVGAALHLRFSHGTAEATVTALDSKLFDRSLLTDKAKGVDNQD
jgi:exodeoxyribonuclease VII large subunit